jgi:mono/diheme cytochrome c family protein
MQNIQSKTKPEHSWSVCIATWFATMMLTTLVIFLSGCSQKKRSPDPSKAETSAIPTPTANAAGTSTQAPPTFSDFPVPAKPADTEALVTHGKEVYAQNCASCHGQQGDGHGVCSAFLVPSPRDFTAAHYKFRSTALGQLPTDEDLFRIVSLGVRGTPMPPWKWLLNDSDRWAVVEYVKTFSPRFADTNQSRSVVADFGAPPPRTESAIAEGKALYTKTGCVTCHGEQGLGNGSSAPSLVDLTGHHISPRDFSKPSGFKAGYSAREIVRTFMTGIDGTPMPGFANVVSNQDAWKLAYYVQTFAKPTITPIARASQGFAHQEQLGSPDIQVKLLERAWKYVPNEIHVKKGQVVEITFQPTDNGLGAGHGFAISSYDEVAFINGALVGAPKTVKFRADRAGKFTFYCATQCSTDKLHPLMNGTLFVEDVPTKTASAQ